MQSHAQEAWSRAQHPELARPALTIVEVMATVIALGVLLCVILPSAAEVSRYGTSAVCLANLGRIGYANTIYSAMDAADAALPVHRLQFQQDPGNPTYIGAYEWGGKSGVGRPDYVQEWSGTALGSKYGTVAGFGSGSRPLNNILFDESFSDDQGDLVGALQDTQLDLPTVKCPADQGYTGIHFPAFRDEGLSSYDHFGTSYTANIFMTSSGGGGPTYSNSPYLHRVSDLSAPSKTLAYQENNGRFAWSAEPQPNTCWWISGTGVPGTVEGWHGLDWTFNAAFIDGHANTIFMKSFENPNIFSVEDASYEQFRCIIIRGDNWQLDTLPAERVESGQIQAAGSRPSWEEGIE
jgi:hypothetical protein